MIAVNLGRKSTVRVSWSVGGFSDIGTSWQSKDGVKNWKYVFPQFSKRPDLGSPDLDYTMYALTPSFRPEGFSTEALSGEANGKNILEIPGSSGQFLAIW
jgi:hypothetical protein